MAAKKFLSLVGGVPTQVAAVESSSGSGSEGNIVALNSSGQIDPTMLASTGAQTFTASEAIAAGALISIWNSTGVLKIRNADNTSSAKQADGFAPAAITSGATGTAVIGEGYITGLSGLTIGTRYFLGAAGAVTATAPTTTGGIVQSVGIADTTASLEFLPGQVFIA